MHKPLNRNTDTERKSEKINSTCVFLYELAFIINFTWEWFAQYFIAKELYFTRVIKILQQLEYQFCIKFKSKHCYLKEIEKALTFANMN